MHTLSFRNPERGRSLCGPEGSSEGSVAANSLGVPGAGARSRFDPSNKRVLTTYGYFDFLRLETGFELPAHGSSGDAMAHRRIEKYMHTLA
jgi:hypothetical protein